MTPGVLSVFTCFLFAGNIHFPANVIQANSLQTEASYAAKAEHYDNALKLYTQELNLLLASGRRADAGAVYVELAQISHIRGAFPAAEAAYKHGLDLLKRYGPRDDSRLVGGMDGLGWLYVTWGRNFEASRLMEESRLLAERAELSSNALLDHLDTQAAYFTVIGQYSEAQKEWKHALDIRNATWGPDSREYAILLLHFGQASALYHDYPNAERMFRQYLDIEARESGGSLVSRAAAQAELGHVYVQTRNFPEAQHWFDEAMRIFHGAPDTAPLIYSMALCYVGDYYMARGNWNAAEQQYRQALSIREKLLGDNHAAAACMISLSNALKKLHLKHEARQLVARANAILSAEKGPFQDQTVDVLALRNQ